MAFSSVFENVAFLVLLFKIKAKLKATKQNRMNKVRHDLKKKKKQHNKMITRTERQTPSLCPNSSK